MTPELIQRIQQAQIYRSVKYTARSLLDWADDTGFLRFDYSTALKAAEVNNVATLRTHLHIMKRAGIVESYHLNGAVNIAFSLAGVRGERAGMRGERARSDEKGSYTASQNDQSCAVSAQIFAVSAQECAVSAQNGAGNGNPDYIYPHAHAPVKGWLVGINNNTDPMEPTNQPTATISPVEQASTYALLVSIRMKASNAKLISEKQPFSLVRQYVARWWYQRRSVGGKFDEEPGILVKWLADPKNFPPEREYPLEMLRDICPAALTNEEAALLAATKLAFEQTFTIDEAPTEPAVSADELAAIWQAAQPQLEQLASYRAHLQPCRLARLDGDTFVVSAPPGIAEIVQQRFVTALRRSLASATNATRLPVVRVEAHYETP